MYTKHPLGRCAAETVGATPARGPKALTVGVLGEGRKALQVPCLRGVPCQGREVYHALRNRLWCGVMQGMFADVKGRVRLGQCVFPWSIVTK